VAVGPPGVAVVTTSPGRVRSPFPQPTSIISRQSVTSTAAAENCPSTQVLIVAVSLLEKAVARKPCRRSTGVSQR
jgi:hypothetical protein